MMKKLISIASKTFHQQTYAEIIALSKTTSEVAMKCFYIKYTVEMCLYYSSLLKKCNILVIQMIKYLTVIVHCLFI